MATKDGKDHKPAKARRWFSHEGLLLVLTLLVLGFVLYNLWGLLTLLWIPLGQ